MNNQKNHYNYLSVVITIIVVAIIALILYVVFNASEIGANNALTDPKSSPDPITKFILQFSNFFH